MKSLKFDYTQDHWEMNFIGRGRKSLIFPSINIYIYRVSYLSFLACLHHILLKYWNVKVEDKGGNRSDSIITIFFVCGWGSRRFKQLHAPMQLCRAHFSILAIYDGGRLRMINKTPGIYIYLLTEKLMTFFLFRIGACNCLNLRDPQPHTKNIVIIESDRFPPLSSTLTFYKLLLIHVVSNLCNLN
jgi:hypothetical protein